MLVGQFLSYLSARTSLRVIALQDGSDVNGLTREAVLRQAKATSTDVLFELSHMEVVFEVDYGGKYCAIRPSIRLKFRITLVSRDQELKAGYVFAKVSPPEETASKAISRWLEDRGSLATLIEMGYRDALPRIWYIGLPSRDVFPDVPQELRNGPNSD
jgi:hypothetical protein